MLMRKQNAVADDASLQGGHRTWPLVPYLYTSLKYLGAMVLGV